jgi:tripartite-type tricarboxylate transporter receptor subunit TctC
MKSRVISLLLIVLLTISLFAVGCTKPAETEQPKAEFPKEKAIKLVIPYGAGGGVDIAARILASTAPELIDQRIDIVCMPGAGGQEGINFVLQQPADGYTLLVTDYGPLVTTALTEKVNYELSDWTPVTEITSVVPTFFTYADSPIKSIDDWVKAAKEKPGSVSVAHGRHLSVPHLPLMLFDDIAGIQNTHVPTTGGSEALAFVLGKKVDIGASVPSTIGGSVKSGDVIALAVCDEERVASLPDTPTMKELGYDVSLPAWYTIFAPKGVPEETIRFLEEKFIEALGTESAKSMAAKAGVDITARGVDDSVRIYQNTIDNLKSLLSKLK